MTAVAERVRPEAAVRGRADRLQVFAAVTEPILTAEGTRVPGLRFTTPASSSQQALVLTGSMTG